MRFEFDAVLHELADGGAYVAFPGDIRQLFGKGRVKVWATFDGVPYAGSVVNMGAQASGWVCVLCHRGPESHPNPVEQTGWRQAACDH